MLQFSEDITSLIPTILFFHFFVFFLFLMSNVMYPDIGLKDKTAIELYKRRDFSLLSQIVRKRCIIIINCEKFAISSQIVKILHYHRKLWKNFIIITNWIEKNFPLSSHFVNKFVLSSQNKKILHYHCKLWKLCTFIANCEKFALSSLTVKTFHSYNKIRKLCFMITNCGKLCSIITKLEYCANHHKLWKLCIFIRKGENFALSS